MIVLRLVLEISHVISRPIVWVRLAISAVPKKLIFKKEKIWKHRRLTVSNWVSLVAKSCHLAICWQDDSIMTFRQSIGANR